MPKSETKTRNRVVKDVEKEVEVIEREPNTTTSQDEREIIYEKFTVEERSTASDEGPLYAEDMKTYLGWETESEYQKRMTEEQPGSKPEHFLFGDDFHCKNDAGEKVRCWNNANNRPFDMGWCEDLRHTILSGQWAGPHTVPGETVNGETIRISRYARVLSGQHQGTALILADELLQKERAKGNPAFPKYPFWEGHEHPFIETLVVTGLSEDQRVLRTIDYVKPRTLADMLFTMDVFRNNTTAERKELTRMLATAADMLWHRTAAKGYRTHPEMEMFVNRHRRLLKCVEHLFTENNSKGQPQYICKACRWTAWVQYSHCGRCGDTNVVKRDDGGRCITKLRLSAGQCAALCYIMGSSSDKTDSDKYRNDTPPSENRYLDWEYFDKAREFWARLTSDKGFLPVRMAIGKLVDTSPTDEDNPGLGGRGQEKLAILSKAWEVFKDLPVDAGDAFNMEDLEPGGALHLTYSDKSEPKIREKDSQGGEPLPYGQIRLVDENDFGGIDCPPKDGKKQTKSAEREAPVPEAPPEQDIWGPDGLAEKSRKRREEREDEKKEKEQKKRQTTSASKRVEQREKLLASRKKDKETAQEAENEDLLNKIPDDDESDASDMTQEEIDQMEADLEAEES